MTTHFTGLEAALSHVFVRGYTVHALHQEGSTWHCRLKIQFANMAVPRYASGDSLFPAEAVKLAIENAEVILAWRPTLGTLTKLKALKPDLEALLKDI